MILDWSFLHKCSKHFILLDLPWVFACQELDKLGDLLPSVVFQLTWISARYFCEDRQHLRCQCYYCLVVFRVCRLLVEATYMAKMIEQHTKLDNHIVNWLILLEVFS